MLNTIRSNTTYLISYYTVPILVIYIVCIRMKMEVLLKKYYANNISVIARGKLKNYNNELVNIGKLSDDLLVIKSK